MARTMQIEFHLTFACVIRGHHAYKNIWTPAKGERLECHHDSSPDASKHDADSIGIYKDNVVVGHAPKEISRLLNFFLKSNAEARLIAIPNGQRTYEFGLVVPSNYVAILPKSVKFAEKNMEIMKKKLTEINDEHKVDISVEEIICKIDYDE